MSDHDRAVQPSGFITTEAVLTQKQWDDAVRRYIKKANKRRLSRIAYWPPLPRRTRLRLAVRRRIDKICIWLCDHHCASAAALIWRCCGLWPR